MGRQLRIGEAARTLGVSVPVVRVLADHGFLSVEWSAGGRRRFWAWQVEALGRLRAMVGQREEPAEVAVEPVELPASPMPPALLASEGSGGVVVGRVR